MEEVDVTQPGWLLILIEDPSDTDEGDHEFEQVVADLYSYVFFVIFCFELYLTLLIIP